MYSFTYLITSGYNKIYLPQPIQVNRGQFIQLLQSTGRIALDKTSNPKYSDLVWNTQTQWTKLNDQKNWRFYLTTINTFSSYFTTFSINNVYANTGVYTITLTFLSSNQTYYQMVNITDCKLWILKILL